MGKRKQQIKPQRYKKLSFDTRTVSRKILHTKTQPRREYFFPISCAPKTPVLSLLFFSSFLSDAFAYVSEYSKVALSLFFPNYLTTFKWGKIWFFYFVFGLFFFFFFFFCMRVSPFCLLNSNCGSSWPPLILPANYPEINLFQARMPAVLGSEQLFQLPAACHSNGPQLQLRMMSINLPLGRFAQSPHFQQPLPGLHHAPTC